MYIHDTLTAIETIAPQYIALIQECQRDYWQSKTKDLTDLLARQESGQKLSGNEQRMIAEAEQHISLSKAPQEPKQLPNLEGLKNQEIKNGLLEIDKLTTQVVDQQKQQVVKLEKEREENLAYLLQDSKTRILSATAIGEIDPTMAADILGYLSTIPSASSKGRSLEALGGAEAKENNIDNVDRDLAYSDPTLSDAPTIDHQIAQREDNERERENNHAVLEESESISLSHGGTGDTTTLECGLGLETDYDPELDYEENYAGNPFVSYVDPNGMEPQYKPY
jgi:hypothetical protein